MWSSRNSWLTDAAPVVIVTGASAGIGAATARLLADKGAHLVLVARREARLTALAADCAQKPGPHLVQTGDVGEPAFAQTVVAAALKTFGRVDGLVNNAGVGHYVNLSDLPAAAARGLIDTNLLGALHLAQAVIPSMLAAGRGRIVNISSIVSEGALPGMGLYCASKSALNIVSRGLRLELAGTPIRVSTVYPGRTRTEFAGAAYGRGGSRSRLGQVDAERVAATIWKALQTGRSDLFVTPYDWLYTRLNRHFPRSIDWMVSQWVRFQKSQAA